MSERPTAMLTQKDREWLTSDGEMYSGDHAKQQRYQRRKSIRDRVVASLLDFILLFERLNDDEREKIHKELRDEIGIRHPEDSLIGGSIPAPRGITETIGFLYMFHEDVSDFERTVAEAIKKTHEAQEDWESAPARRVTHRQVEIDIDVEEVHINSATIRDKIEAGETDALNDAERQWLIELLAETKQLNDAYTDAKGRLDMSFPQVDQRIADRLEASDEDENDLTSEQQFHKWRAERESEKVEELEETDTDDADG
jgi:hypothetical protein